MFLYNHRAMEVKFPEFSSQRKRLETLLNYNGEASGFELAEAGFFLKDGILQCHCCGMVDEDWTEEDDIVEVHACRSPGCTHAISMARMDASEFPDMSPVEERLKTLHSYKGEASVFELAEAGFFLRDGILQCHCCGMMDDDWTKDNNIAEVHALRSPRCIHIMSKTPIID